MDEFLWIGFDGSVNFLRVVGYGSWGDGDDVCWFEEFLPWKWSETDWFVLKYFVGSFFLEVFDDESVIGFKFDEVDVEIFIDVSLIDVDTCN